MIKSAYRKLAMKYHPDRCVTNGEDPKKCEEIFKEISDAYGYLAEKK